MDSTKESLHKLRLSLLRQHSSELNVIRPRHGIRQILISKIEDIILKITETIANDEVPYFLSIDFSKSTNCLFNERLQLKDSDAYKRKKISFGRSSSRLRFATIIFLLSKIHKLLMSCKTSTRRELYYKNLDIFNTQSEVDDAMRDICYIIGAPSWELGVISTAKGVVAGPLIFKSDDGIISCNKPGGVLIPQNVLELELVSTSIHWVLIVEKDAAFQDLFDGNGLSKLNNCLIITGKGYPDVNTRLLVRRLWECFKIPILVLVDADPYGLEIMCIYRFGSTKSSLFSDSLACPSVRWLGIHPSDIKHLAAEYTELTERDCQKLSNLIRRPYVQENKRIQNEVNISNVWVLPRENFPFFYRFFKDRTTWDEAYRVCDSHGGSIITPSDVDQRDVLRAYLKELDVINHVWIGLTKQTTKTFAWLNGETVYGDGYWLEPIPKSSQRLCVATDPTSDFRWVSNHCQGPEIASFVCQLIVPDWANGCMISELPSLSITLVPETGIVELMSDCGLAGTRRIACKGRINRDDVIRHLSCDEDPFTDRSVTERMKESNTPHSSTARLLKDGSTQTTRGWSWTPTERLTRHRRGVTPTISANISDSSIGKFAH